MRPKPPSLCLDSCILLNDLFYHHIPAGKAVHPRPKLEILAGTLTPLPIILATPGGNIKGCPAYISWPLIHLLGPTFPIGFYGWPHCSNLGSSEILNNVTAGHRLMCSVAPNPRPPLFVCGGGLKGPTYSEAQHPWLVLQVYAVFCAACVECIRWSTWIRGYMYLLPQSSQHTMM